MKENVMIFYCYLKKFIKYEIETSALKSGCGYPKYAEHWRIRISDPSISGTLPLFM